MSIASAMYFESLATTNDKNEVLELNRKKENIISLDAIKEYYLKIADYIFPYLKNRPQALRRDFSKDFQEIISKKQRINSYSYAMVYEIESYENETRDADCIVCYNKDTLEYINNLGCIEVTPWHSTIESLDNPDYLIVAIEPSRRNTFFQVMRVAKALKTILDKINVESYCKTSGETGLHIYLPMGKKYTYRMVRELAYTLCMHVNMKLPELTSMKKDQAAENQKVFLNYQLNRRGYTIVAPYSVRSYPWAPVATPLLWSELKDDLNPFDFNINTIPARLEKCGDIFSGILERGIDLENTMKILQIE